MVRNIVIPRMLVRVRTGLVGLYSRLLTQE
jgi:hypothetical protein